MQSGVQYDSKALKVQYLESENQEAAKKIRYLEDMLQFMVEAQNEFLSDPNSSMQARP